MKTAIKTIISLPLAILRKVYRLFHILLSLAVTVLIPIAIIQGEWGQVVFFGCVWVGSFIVGVVIELGKRCL